DADGHAHYPGFHIANALSCRQSPSLTQGFTGIFWAPSLYGWRPLYFRLSAIRAFLYSVSDWPRREHFMKTLRSATFLVAVLLGAMWYGLDLTGAPATGRQITSSPPKPPVYVSDFDI